MNNQFIVKYKSTLKKIEWVLYICLIAFLLYWLDWSAILVTLKSANIIYAVPGILIASLIPLIEAERIRIALGNKCNINRITNSLINSHAIVLGHISFGALAGDAYRLLAYKQMIGNWHLITSALILVRLIGLVCIALITLGFGWVVFQDKSLFFADLFQPLMYSVLLVIAGITGFVLLTPALLRFLNKRNIINLKESRKIKHIEVLLVTLWVLFAQCLRTFVLIFAAKTFSIELPIYEALFVVAAAQMFSLIPVPLNGLGVREGAIAILLNAFGVVGSVAISIAFALRAISFLGALLAFFISTILNKILVKNKLEVSR